MSKVKLLVVESNACFDETLLLSLQSLEYEILEYVSDYEEAVTALKSNLPEVILIHFSSLEVTRSIDLVKQLKNECDLPFVFLLSGDNIKNINLLKEAMPQAFVVKPFAKEELSFGVEMALDNMRLCNKRSITKNHIAIKDALFIKDKGVFTKIMLQDIVYIKSSHVYLEFVLKGNKVLIGRDSMQNILLKLNPSFIRIHRSFIINGAYVDKISSDYVMLNNFKLPIGIKYRKALMDSLHKC